MRSKPFARLSFGYFPRRRPATGWRSLARGGESAREAEEADKLEDEAHDEEPRVAREVGLRDEEAPEHDEQHRVEDVADVAQHLESCACRRHA